jgi:hypothetical protein
VRQLLPPIAKFVEVAIKLLCENHPHRPRRLVLPLISSRRGSLTVLPLEASSCRASPLDASTGLPVVNRQVNASAQIRVRNCSHAT